MKSIGEFFARIRNKQTDEIRLRLSVQEIIEKYAKTKLPFDAISFSIKTISIKGLSQGAKSAIFIKKPVILKELAEKVPNRPIEYIRLD
ncbi:MAG: hypothetical protein JWO00_165 [Candidatus Parcubacteria bacterium]|nr:hypothetical protein [Candidatus Parcubacteria bacterium]